MALAYGATLIGCFPPLPGCFDPENGFVRQHLFLLLKKDLGIIPIGGQGKLFPEFLKGARGFPFQDGSSQWGHAPLGDLFIHQTILDMHKGFQIQV